jgi:hypothetical protein
METLLLVRRLDAFIVKRRSTFRVSRKRLVAGESPSLV